MCVCVCVCDCGGVPLFKSTVDAGGIVKLLRIPGEHAQKISGTEARKLEDSVKGLGAKGLGSARLEAAAATGSAAAWTQSPFGKTLSSALREAIAEAISATPGDLLLFQFGSPKLCNTVLASLRQQLGKRLELITPSWRFLWVTDFPMFELAEGDKWVAAHHPFTSPRPEDVELLVKANGAQRPKVFKLKQLELAPRETAQVGKTLLLAQLTTRTHYPGQHAVDVLINGQAYRLGTFELTEH